MWTRSGIAVLVATLCSLAACRRHADACDEAVARLARIAAAQGEPAAPPRTRAAILEQCRTAPGSADPVLRCALDSPTDEAAAACVEAVIDSTLRPQAGAADETGPRGLNPLLGPGAD